MQRGEMKMTKTILQSIVDHRSEPIIRAKQHMCMNKGYTYQEMYELLFYRTINYSFDEEQVKLAIVAANNH